MRIPTASCQQIGALPGGGVVFELAQDDRGQVWAGTSAGLFVKEEAGWKPVIRGFPFRQAPVVAVGQKTVLAAGPDGGMARSADRGRTWQRCLLPPQAETITCLALSPRFLQDGVALAGTERQGMLRSVDGGRSWKLANFGLRHFQVSALEVGPAWQRKEPVFAALEQGIYYSPNAGRAWQLAGLQDASILSIAISPQYMSDGVVAAGAMDGMVYFSHDHGRSWAASSFPGEQDPVNRLLFAHDGMLLAGTGGGRLMASGDLGASWKVVTKLPEAILSLACAGDALFAGAGALGVFCSSDQGKSWRPDQELLAWRVHVLSIRDGELAAVGGVEAGLWFSRDGGNRWIEVKNDQGERTACLSLAWQGGTLLAASASGLLSFKPHAQQGRVEPVEGSVLAVAARGKDAWAGCMDGSLWKRSGEGARWERVDSPCPGAVIAIECHEAAGEDDALLVASYNETSGRLEFWCSGGQGGSWTLLGVEMGPNAAVRCAYLDGTWFVALGARLLFSGQRGWQRASISSDDAPVNVLLAVPSRGLLAATSDRLLYSRDGLEWTRLPCEMAEYGIADLEIYTIQQERILAGGITGDGRYFTLDLVFP